MAAAATLSTRGLLDCHPRWASRRNPARKTLGPQVAKVAAALGKPLMPWQAQVANVALEVDEYGRLVYREVVVHVMRQQGKTTLQLPVLAHRCIGFGRPQHVTYAAQSGVAARKKLFDEHFPMLRDSPMGARAKLRRQSGQEAILWENGSRHTLTAATEKAGHGDVLDLAVIDEAFAYTDARLEQAFVPAMQTRPEPQLWVMSTAGTESSSYLRAKVDAGRARVESGQDDLVAYFEWSFADDDDPFDLATWRRRMPALGYTVDERAIAAAAASMEEREFLRAFGNRWLDVGAGGSPIPADSWGARFDSSQPLDGRVSFALAVAEDLSWSVIGVAGVRPDGVRQVEIVDNRRGTAWVADRVVELQARWQSQGVALAPSSAAAALLTQLWERGVAVTEVTGRELPQACVGFLNAVVEGSVRHRNDPALNSAVQLARSRPAGDAWVFSQRHSSADISPLWAVVLALHEANKLEAVPATWVPFRVR